MDYENLINLAFAETLQLLNGGVRQPLTIIKTKYSAGDLKMSEEQWNSFYQNLPVFILENADNSQTVRNFLADYSVLSNPILETAAKNENVELEYMSLFLKKLQEELLVIACTQQSTDLLDYLLEKDNSLSNFKMFDGRYILHYAMQYGSEDIIKTLIYYGAILDTEDSKGKNVLHYAVMNESDAIWLRYSNEPKLEKFLKRADCYGIFPERG